jgi:uncharacterized small protein (DUF1192 family)
MDADEGPLNKTAPVWATEPLDAFSLNELDERIALLRSEVVRCETMIASKRSSNAAAEDVFKK